MPGPTYHKVVARGVRLNRKTFTVCWQSENCLVLTPEKRIQLFILLAKQYFAWAWLRGQSRGHKWRRLGCTIVGSKLFWNSTKNVYIFHCSHNFFKVGLKICHSKKCQWRGVGVKNCKNLPTVLMDGPHHSLFRENRLRIYKSFELIVSCVPRKLIALLNLLLHLRKLFLYPFDIMLNCHGFKDHHCWLLS